MSKSDFILTDLASNGAQDASTPLFSQQDPQQLQTPLNPHQKFVDLQVYAPDQDSLPNNAIEAHSRDLFQAMEPNLQYRSSNKVATQSKL